MTLLVKNEIDLIKTHINYHLPQIDLLVVMDNCSTDGTYEYIKGLKDDRIVLLTQAAQNYAQKLWVSRMIQTAIRLGADWVINADADEFFVGNIRGLIEKAQEQGYNQIYPKGTVFYTTEPHNPESNPIKEMVYRDHSTVKYYSDKVIHSTSGFLSVSQGNHWVFFDPSTQPKVLHTDEIKLFHYPVRSWQQFLNKYTDAIPTKIANMGHLWNHYYEIYKNQGEQVLKEHYLNDYILTEDIIKAKNLERDTSLAERII